MERHLLMSHKELGRKSVLELVKSERITLMEAGKADFDLADEATITARDTRHGPPNDNLLVADGRRLKIPCTASTPDNVGPVARRTA